MFIKLLELLGPCGYDKGVFFYGCLGVFGQNTALSLYTPLDATDPKIPHGHPKCDF